MQIDKREQAPQVEIESVTIRSRIPPFVGNYTLELADRPDLILRRVTSAVTRLNNPYFKEAGEGPRASLDGPSPSNVLGYYVGKIDKPRDAFGEEAARGAVFYQALITAFGPDGPTMAESRLSKGEIATVGTEQWYVDLELYEFLDMTARLELNRLRTGMDSMAEEARDQTAKMVGDALKRYKVVDQGFGRIAEISIPHDTRDFGIERASLHTIYEQASYRDQRGYRLRALLFNGTIKGPHAIAFIEEKLR